MKHQTKYFIEFSEIFNDSYKDFFKISGIAINLIDEREITLQQVEEINNEINNVKKEIKKYEKSLKVITTTQPTRIITATFIQISDNRARMCVITFFMSATSL